MADCYEIATWRFQLIAPFFDPSLPRALRRKALSELTSGPILWPRSEADRRAGRPPKKKPISKSTLFRWMDAYRAGGLLGLMPKPRDDRGASKLKGADLWISYAIGLLFEQPQRSLTQLVVYLRVEFEDYDLSRSSLHRRLRAHEAYAGIQELRSGKESRLRDRYEADHPHECWQLDGKGRFTVRFKDGTRVEVHVLTVLDDHSRAVLAAVISFEETTDAAIRVFLAAANRYGLPDRFQFDRGSAFDSHDFRNGLAQCGVHRNWVKARNPRAQGKIEAYHKSLGRWFVKELRSQEVIDLVHLEQLLCACLDVIYNEHHHREIRTTPKKRLAGRHSDRRLSPESLSRAFFVKIEKKSDPTTGEVRLPSGSFRVPRPHAGLRRFFLYDRLSEDHALLLLDGGREEIRLEPFRVKPLPDLGASKTRRGTGQLQKILDIWQGQERPNAQPGFGLSEVFRELGHLLGRLLPQTKREAREVLDFYRKNGPVSRESFLLALRRTWDALGEGRPLSAYLNHIERQIIADRDRSESPEDEENIQ